MCLVFLRKDVNFDIKQQSYNFNQKFLYTEININF